MLLMNEKEGLTIMNRNLDGCYFRVEGDGKWGPVCFSHLTQEEREKMTAGRSAEWLKSLCFHLADVIKKIGDEFDIVCE